MATLKILAVCYGNRCRSPMFQALLTRELAKRDVDASVESAGMMDDVGLPASEPALQCMRERGLDLSSHRNRHVSSVDLADFDAIYVMEERFVVPLIALGARADMIQVLNRKRGGILNPYELGLEAYRACAEDLEAFACAIAHAELTSNRDRRT